MSVRDDQLDTLKVGGKDYDFYRIADLPGIDHLPYSLKVLVENLVRNIDGANITDDHVKALLDWDPAAQPSHEIQFTPSRVVMQDFTGVPCIVDLATMRDAVKELGGDPEVINPQVQSDMVIDHSVQIDKYGVADAVEQNMDIEYQRNGERYQFLRWGQQAFRNFRVVPPGTGIIHQVNIEYLAKVVMTKAGSAVATSPTSTPAWAPIRTPPPSTVWACSAGASAASKPKPPCSASQSPCSCRASSASSSPVPFRKASPPPTWSSPSPTCSASTVWSANSWNSTAKASLPCRWPTAPPSATWDRNSAPPAASSRSTTSPSTICV